MKPKRKEIQVPQPSDPTENVTDEAVHKELGDSLVMAATTTSSLEAEQDSGGGPRCQETIGDSTTQTRFESVSKHSNELLLAKVNVAKEVVEVINTAKLIIDAAQVSSAGDIVSTASAATTVSAATITTATTVDDITLAQALA
ncbi:hypothetical protein Tco_1439258 [Tanacetum coccineum]